MYLAKCNQIMQSVGRKPIVELVEENGTETELFQVQDHRFFKLGGIYLIREQIFLGVKYKTAAELVTSGEAALTDIFPSMNLDMEA